MLLPLSQDEAVGLTAAASVEMGVASSPGAGLGSGPGGRAARSKARGKGRSAGGAVFRTCSAFPEYLSRVVDWRQMDLDASFYQMVTLCAQPSKVYKSAYYRKQTKNRWARDDPGFAAIQFLFLLVATVAWAVAFRAASFSSFVSLLFHAFVVEWLAFGLAISTLCWWIANHHFRMRSRCVRGPLPSWLDGGAILTGAFTMTATRAWATRSLWSSASSGSTRSTSTATRSSCSSSSSTCSRWGGCLINVIRQQTDASACCSFCWRLRSRRTRSQRCCSATCSTRSAGASTRTSRSLAIWVSFLFLFACWFPTTVLMGTILSDQPALPFLHRTERFLLPLVLIVGTFVTTLLLKAIAGVQINFAHMSVNYYYS